MAQSINLIPQEEKQEQVREKAVKAGTVVSLLILLLVLGISGYYYWQIRSLQQESDGAEARIQELRKEITNLAQIEISARNLDAKFSAVQSIYADRNYFSILLSELSKRVPANVVIANLSLDSGDPIINISGTGSDYISIAQFIKTLSDQNFPSAGDGLAALFTNVTLTTVNLDSQNSSAKYFIIIDFDESLLKK
ncbi:MAG: PilN domain-containing protein [Patescibacteria group bacterium]